LADDLRRLGRDLAPEATGAKDFEDTAEIMRGLGMIVTVDTSVAHLAGALGKPAYVLLAHDACWRWGTGDRSALYPSARLIRQPFPGEWGTVLRRLRTYVGL
jgi:ADP-heptose:LPS heptosyltransferase